MRTRSYNELEAQFDRMTHTYGYDAPHRESARLIFLRYRYNITHTEPFVKWSLEMKSMLRKDGGVMKRFEDDYYDIKGLRDNYRVPYEVYGKVEYEWVVSIPLYHTMVFKDERSAIAHRNELMAKYLDRKVELRKVIKGTFI